MSSRPTPIEALAGNPATSGLVLDFDGVLSPIINDPAASRLPDETAASLARLARTLGLLAVISGRPVEFLADRIPIPGVYLLGSYGMEQIRDGVRRVDPDTKKWLGPVREASRALRDLLSASQGVVVEEKPVSVTVHWRQAQDQATAARDVRRATAQMAGETGLRLASGKLAEELLPPIDVDKGSALVTLLASKDLTTVAYAGDDVGDIPALRAVRAAGGYALVVDHGHETDPLLLKLADQTYAGTDRFAAWLADLARATGGTVETIAPHAGLRARLWLASLVTITACMAQRPKAGSGKPGRTGRSRAPAGAVQLIVCTYPPENGWLVHTMLNGRRGGGRWRLSRVYRSVPVP